jgi:hypothetical protein
MEFEIIRRTYEAPRIPTTLGIMTTNCMLSFYPNRSLQPQGVRRMSCLVGLDCPRSVLTHLRTCNKLQHIKHSKRKIMSVSSITYIACLHKELSFFLAFSILAPSSLLTRQITFCSKLSSCRAEIFFTLSCTGLYAPVAFSSCSVDKTFVDSPLQRSGSGVSV